MKYDYYDLLLFLGAAVSILFAPIGSIVQAAPTYYDDIRPIIEQKCIACHSEQGVSFSFENTQATYSFKAAIVDAIVNRRMPPWLAEAGHQNYADDYSLTQYQVDAVAKWAETGYQKGHQQAVAFNLQKKKQGLTHGFKPDIRLPILKQVSYLPNQNRKDDYRCFLVDWPQQEKSYITGFQAKPGNLRVAHHLVIFLVQPEIAEHFKKLAAEETGEGYSCFGGAIPDRLAMSPAKDSFESQHPGLLEKLNENTHWLAHWAPGMEGYKFPKDTGIPVRPGALLIVQMHYYSGFAPGEPDRDTEMLFQVKDQVAKPALNVALTHRPWLLGRQNGSMSVQVGQKAHYETSVQFDKVAQALSHRLEIPLDEIGQIEIHSTNLHMHSYGVSGRVRLIDQYGRQETLLSIPDWNLHWQRDFTFTVPKVLSANAFGQAALRVECDFTNPTQKVVYGGFGSDDEMCFNFSYLSIVSKKQLQAAKSN